MSAFRVAAQEVKLPPGDYAYCVQRWAFKGLREENELAYTAMKLDGEAPLPGRDAEAFIVGASRSGLPLPNAANVLGDLGVVGGYIQVCEAYLDEQFAEKLGDFEAQNDVRCKQQDTSARKYAERRTGELRRLLERYEERGQERPTRMTKGRIQREEEQLSAKLARIDAFRTVDPTQALLSIGVIRVG